MTSAGFQQTVFPHKKTSNQRAVFFRPGRLCWSMYLFHIVVQQLGTALAKSFTSWLGKQPSRTEKTTCRFHRIHVCIVYFSRFGGIYCKSVWLHVSYMDPMGFEATNKSRDTAHGAENFRFKDSFATEVNIDFSKFDHSIWQKVFHHCSAPETCNASSEKESWRRCF